jgi:hypothetical protein
LGHRAAYSAHPDDTQPRTADLFADHEGGRPAVPSARAHDPVSFSSAAGGAQHQEHSDFGRRVGEDIWRVSHVDPTRSKRRQVAVIETNAMSPVSTLGTSELIS